MTTDRPTTRLTLEPLDDRIVPAVDLSSQFTGQPVAVGDAIVSQVTTQPTGTGVIQSFLRIQGAASGGPERGYNTDARPLQLNENKSPQFTRSLTVGAVPVVNVGGVNYREFLLDINQKSSAPKLSLDTVRIFLGGAPNLTATKAEAAGGVKTLGGLTPTFELADAVLLNARFNSGSGSGDMVLLVPDAAFAGAASSDYVYLYSEMGKLPGYQANGGFEEWAVRAVGAPQTGSLSGQVVNARGGAGIAGVELQLTGVDLNGNPISFGTDAYGQPIYVAVVKTGSDGTFRFDNLPAGTYTLTEIQPAGYADGADEAGDFGGDHDGIDTFTNIQIGAGEKGGGYTFYEEPFGTG